MSQLFDALSRGRQQRFQGSPQRTAYGDAVLATLGYGPTRGSRRARSWLITWLVAAALLLAAWTMWRLAPLSGASDARAELASLSTARTAAGAASPSSVARPPAVPSPQTLAPLSATSSVLAPLPVVHTEPAWVSPGGAPMPRPITTDRGIDGMRRALYHHRAGEFEQALIAYRAILTQDELNAPAHNNLGMLYQEKNLLDEAGREFQRAVLIDPGYALAHNNYGATLLRQGHAAAAATAFRTVIALDPRNADAVVNLALAQAAAGQGAQARATLVRALGMSPRHAAAHYNLAVICDEAGESARAVEHYAIFLDTAEPGQAGYVPQVRTRIEALSKR